MATTKRKRRIPKLAYTAIRGIGWHVSFRDPVTLLPRKHVFGRMSREQAEIAYHEWVLSHLRGETPSTKPAKTRRKLVEQLEPPKPKSAPITAEIVSGSLVHIASGYLEWEESRVRDDGEPRRRNSIDRKQYEEKKMRVEEFLKFINTRHGIGSVGRMTLADLTMEDVERYNRLLVESDMADSTVKKRMHVVKAIINRAGRSEHGHQLLTWNWDSRDTMHGRPGRAITLPTLRQLKLILAKCNTQRTAQVWLAIGCGFGQGDLTAMEVGCIDRESYDLRRCKTGLDRWGSTPPLVWNCIEAYLEETPRQNGDLMFLTEQGYPLVHGKTDSIAQWWDELRRSLKDDGKGLDGFYSLRHLGATEYGSRPGCSIGDMRRWMGHATSSQICDQYMKPVSPQTREVVEWLRKSLQAETADLSLPK